MRRAALLLAATLLYGCGDDVTTVKESGPSFWAYSTGRLDQDFSTGSEIVFDAEVYDSAGAHSTETGRFTPGINGYCLASGQVRLDFLTPGTAASEMSIRKNGQTAPGSIVVTAFIHEDGTGQFEEADVSGVFSMTTGDHLSVWIAVNTDTSVDMVGGAGNNYFFAHCFP